MKNVLGVGIITLLCYGVATCQSTPSQRTTAPDTQQTQPATQKIILTKIPPPDLTDNDLHKAWIKVSNNTRRYRPIRRGEFKMPRLRPFQCHRLNECFLIVADQTIKDASRFKILVLYASDSSYKRRTYKPYWVTCNQDLRRTSLWNSDIGVVAIEYLDGGGQKVSVLKWDEEKKTFTCTEVRSYSLVYPEQ